MKFIQKILAVFALFMSITFVYAKTKRKPPADILFYNAKIYTVNNAFEKVEAFAVMEGKIIATGKSAELRASYDFVKEVNLEGKYVYPGFIDAHCHFMSLGAYQFEVDLRDAKSWDEVLKRCVSFYQKNPEIKMIRGRGWDQNIWANKQFPVNAELNKLFPLIPVLLKRVDGHAAVVNNYVLQKAGYNAQTKIEGGELLTTNNILTGVVIDNALDQIANNSNIFPPKDDGQMAMEFDTAQTICFSKGLTSIGDAGIPQRVANFYKSYQHQIRIYAMLDAHEDNMGMLNQPFKTNNLNISSFKLYVDGSLGSRGACLLQSYTDQKGHYGFLTRTIEDIEQFATRIAGSEFQLNSHCIGDSANRLIINMYSKYLQPGNERRWRIEHAQVINETDLEKLSMYNIVPSVQPTHATSDMPWVENRLGKARLPQAYAYRKLLNNSRFIALGTDAPVEDINPLHTFYAAVTRQNEQAKPIGGFTPDEKLTREEALRGMTIWAATAAFEEKEKGSIERDKFADFVVLDVDLLNDDMLKIRNARVLYTYLGGELMFSLK